MAYTPDWEPLAGALRRVVAAGATEDQAKLDLCGAVGDGKIRVRVRVAESDQTRRGQTFYDGKGTGQRSEGSGCVSVPHRLAPTDFDWEASRPLAPWPIGPRFGERREPEWIRGRENRPLDLIELSTADVTNVLRLGDRTNGAAQSSTITTAENAPDVVAPSTTAASQENAATEARAANLKKIGVGAKTRGIKEAIHQLWPNGIPEGLSAKDRDNKIVAQLKANQSSVPGNIARAVQRVLAKRQTI